MDLTFCRKTDINMEGVCFHVRLFIKKGSSSSLSSDPSLTVKVFVIYIFNVNVTFEVHVVSTPRLRNPAININLIILLRESLYTISGYFK